MTTLNTGSARPLAFHPPQPGDGPLGAGLPPERLRQAAAGWLAQRGHLLLGEPERARVVNVEINSTAAIVSLALAGGTHLLVVKQLPPGTSAEAFCALRERVRARSARLAQSLPRYLGFEREHRLVLREYIEGSTPLALLKAGLRSRRSPDQNCRQLLLEGGGLLAELGGLGADELGLVLPARRNESFLAGLRELWQNPALRRHLPAGWHDPCRLLDYLPPSFSGREGRQLSLTDLQPKNALSTDGRFFFIDINYDSANPAMAAAQFLVTLDNLGLRRPFGGGAARIAEWKRCFLSGYGRVAPHVLGDVIFFYPWKVLQFLEQHLQRRPWYRPYLTWYYGRLLGAYLSRLQQFSPAEVRRDPGKGLAAP